MWKIGNRARPKCFNWDGTRSGFLAIIKGMVTCNFKAVLQFGFSGGAEEDLPHWGRPKVLREEDELVFEEPLFNLNTGRSLYNPLLVDDHNKKVPLYPNPRAPMHSRVTVLL